MDKGTDRDLVYHATLEFVSFLTLLYSLSVKCGPIYNGVRSNVSRSAFYNMLYPKQVALCHKTQWTR